MDSLLSRPTAIMCKILLLAIKHNLATSKESLVIGKILHSL